MVAKRYTFKVDVDITALIEMGVIQKGSGWKEGRKLVIGVFIQPNNKQKAHAEAILCGEEGKGAPVCDPICSLPAYGFLDYKGDPLPWKQNLQYNVEPDPDNESMGAINEH